MFDYRRVLSKNHRLSDDVRQLSHEHRNFWMYDVPIPIFQDLATSWTWVCHKNGVTPQQM